ncbi:MAG: hypothetical protein A2Z47_04485 [Thermodesulfovibrio sp. RBG_19FT_COMBO_42_12]|nr:MAG: hypothetical protein A2Z47_04485 [Thermodesulfovibrio sp. RBG_19FT_COMBO_42_12]HZX48165.1 flagellar protein FlaG [Nitrospirota bacterium]
MDIKTTGISGFQINKTDTDQVSRDPVHKTKPEETTADKGNNVSVHDMELPIQNRAVFAIDKYKNVTIQILDKNGEVVRQIPAEEYIEMARKMKEEITSIFSEWA